MTLVGIRYFIALAEMRNFSQVAKKYYVAQAAVSYQISAMEKELGVKLFERTTRSVNLTPVGRRLYMKLKAPLEQIDEAVSEIQSHPSQQTFVLGYSRVCFGKRFRAMLDMLSQEHPDIEFVLEIAEPEDDLYERIHEGKIDAALFFNPTSVLPDYLQHISFGRRIGMIVPEGHPCANLPYIRDEDVPRENLLVSEGMRRIEQLWDKADAAWDHSDTILRDLETVLAMVQAGRGVACLPVLDDVGVTGLRYVPIVARRNRSKQPELVLAWNKGSDSPLLRSTREAAEKLMTGFAKDINQSSL